MSRANRYHISGQIWHIVALEHPCSSRHKNVPVQNTLFYGCPIIFFIRQRDYYC